MKGLLPAFREFCHQIQVQAEQRGVSGQFFTPSLRLWQEEMEIDFSFLGSESNFWSGSEISVFVVIERVIEMLVSEFPCLSS